MTSGDLYRFKERAFGRGHYHRLNGLPFLVVKRTPPEIEGMSHAVDILVDEELMSWSERVLLDHVEVI